MEEIKGTAAYRERIAMPPGVTFEVRLEDVSLMDVPAKILSTLTINDAGNPPYRFSLPYNPDTINEGARYTVRASLRMGDRLLFTTDIHTPVLTNGAGTDVDITMVKVQSAPESTRRMIGEFVYFADSASFTECGSEETFPVAMESAYLEAERGYLAARDEAMAPVIVVFEGKTAVREGMEGGTREMAVIERLVGFVPGLTCERAMADATVENTYWRILSVAGNTLRPLEGQREAHMMLRPNEGFSSTVGCNIIIGQYDLTGGKLSLGAGPMTLKACPPPLDEMEREWVQSLASVSDAIVTGPTLELRNSEGSTVAFLEAVALP